MKNATANNATVNNAKVNNAKVTMHTVDDIHTVFVKSIGTTPLRINFSDATQQYTGFTDFSVNMKRATYRVYMSDANAKLCTGIDNTLTVCDAPHSTKNGSRDFYIDFTDFNVLKQCIESVAKHAVSAYNATKTKTAKVTKTKTAKVAKVATTATTENV